MVVLKRSLSLTFWLIGIGIAAFWLASVVWLIQITAPRTTAPTRPVSYASLLSRFQGELNYDLLHGQNRIGDLVYRNFLSLQGRSVSWALNVGFVAGSVGGSNASGFAMLDSDGSLKSFELTLRIAGKTSRIRGETTNGIISLDSEGIGPLPATILPMDSTMTLSDGFLPGLPGVCPAVGERLTWRVFDPLSMQPQDVSLQRYGSDILPPAPEDGCVLVMSHGGLETFIWVDGAGVVTRERTSLGMELVLAPQGQDDNDHEVTRFFPEMIGTVHGPPWPEQLVVEIVPSRQLPTSRRQAADRESGVYVLRSEPKRSAIDWPVGSPVDLESLAVSSLVSSTPLVRSIQRELGPLSHEETTVDSLARWVLDTIRQGPPEWPVSFEEILEDKRGDSLARALLLERLLEGAGYQVEICYGLSLRHDTPRFHAWVSVCMDDRCTEVDPSIHTLLPDATMLCLKRDIAAGSPYRRMQTIGNILVRVVEVQYQ